MRKVAGTRADQDPEWAATARASNLPGAHPETVLKWMRRDEVDVGARPGVTTEEAAEVKRMETLTARPHDRR